MKVEIFIFWNSVSFSNHSDTNRHIDNEMEVLFTVLRLLSFNLENVCNPAKFSNLEKNLKLGWNRERGRGNIYNVNIKSYQADENMRKLLIILILFLTV